MRIICLALLCLFSTTAFSQTCLESAREVQPQLPAEVRRDFETKLDEAQRNFKTSPTADNLIWVGRRTAYQGQYKEAIRIFSKGIETFPRDPRIFRHRGHRFITLRCFDLAIADFKQAAKLVKGKPDEVEPDGLPNSQNIPTSTLQSNIWYHLGLAYYLKGYFKQALTAYREAEKVSNNPDMLVATTHWLYMTLRRLGRVKEANGVLNQVGTDLQVIENADYLKLIKLYQGRSKLEDLLKETGANANTLSNASVGYGLGNWFLYNRRASEAQKIFRQIVDGTQWSSFGYVAAEVELSRK